jgi:hypothetical protein
MPTQKLYFDVIPVATVKKIAERLPEEEKQRLEEKERAPDWRALAQQVQRETDGDKMIHLVQRLIEKFDEEKLLKAAQRAASRV